MGFIEAIRYATMNIQAGGEKREMFDQSVPRLPKGFTLLSRIQTVTSDGGNKMHWIGKFAGTVGFVASIVFLVTAATPGALIAATYLAGVAAVGTGCTFSHGRC